MMPSVNTVTTIPKNYTNLVVLALLSLLLIYQFDTYRPISAGLLTSDTSYKRSVKLQNGCFRWEDRVQNFPLSSFFPVPSGTPKSLPAVQHTFGPESSLIKQKRLQRREQVKQVFQKCWQPYREQAWMYDELPPLSGGGRDTYGGWGATLVDALDTLWIMDMKTEFHEAATAARSIDFTTSTDSTIVIFETTIRYLGGFLGAYDQSGEKSLLNKALEVGEMLLVAFDTPNHLPITRWEWQKAADGQPQETPDSVFAAEVGTLSLEFTRLSQLTGDQRFYDAIKRITMLFDAQQNETKLPGMWPVVVNLKDQDLRSDSNFTLGGLSDSLYEYLPKEYALLGGLDPIYQKMYEQSMETAVESLLFRPMTPNEDDILISGDVHAASSDRPSTLEPKGGHLACFAGGMLALGGRLFQIDEHLSLARKLTQGCIWAYHAMERGIMPEITHFVPCDDKSYCPWNENKWLEGVMSSYGDSLYSTAQEIVEQENLPKGYTSIDDARYMLRPEAIESVFYMWRITGDEKYREDAWKMWTAIGEMTQTQLANAAIVDITVGRPDNVTQDDRMESYWFAETLKYFYLIFSEPGLISLDEYVLNTEAHPLRRYRWGLKVAPLTQV